MTTEATIPNVQDQLKQWVTSRASDEPQREIIADRDLTILGTVGRSTFATHGDRELRLRGPVMSYELERAPADAVLVTKPGRDSQARPRTDVYIGRVVERGTYARTAAQATYARKVRPPSPVDRDAELRRSVPRTPITFGADDDSPSGIIKGTLSKQPGLLITDGRARFATIADEIAWLNSAGVALALSPDGAHLLVASQALTPERQTMLSVRASLYRAYLAGEPIRCAWPHEGEAPEAVTIAVGNAPVCDAHLQGGTGE